MAEVQVYTYILRLQTSFSYVFAVLKNLHLLMERQMYILGVSNLRICRCKKMHFLIERQMYILELSNFCICRFKKLASPYGEKNVHIGL